MSQLDLAVVAEALFPLGGPRCTTVSLTAPL